MAQRQALALQRQAAARQNAAAGRARVQHLDLSKAQGERQAYDFDGDDGFEEKSAPAAAARAAASGSAGRGGASSPARSGKGGSGSAGGQPPKGPGKGKAGKGGDGGKKGKKGKKKAKWWKILLATLLVLVVIFGGTFALIMHAIRPEIGSATLSELLNTPKGLDGEQLNILVLGIDRSSEGGEMHAGTVNDSQTNDGNTDMIMYVQLDFVNDEVRMLQIPRNIIVTEDSSVSGNYQINNVAKTQGTDNNNNYSALAQLIHDQLGLYIDGYVAIRLEALVQLVDLLGPIQVYVPEEITYTDEKTGEVTSHLDQGLQWMDGATAEFFLRARKTYAQSDIQRLNVQRYFYSAMFARLRAMTVWDIARILPVCMNYMETDLRVSQLVSAAISLLSVSSDHIMLCSVPVYIGNIRYNNNDVVVVDRTKTAELLNTYFRTAETQVAAEELGVLDTAVDVSGYSSTDPNVQYMGGLNEEVISSAQEGGVEIDPNAVYETPAPEPTPDPNAASEDGSTEDGSAADGADSGQADTADDAA